MTNTIWQRYPHSGDLYLLNQFTSSSHFLHAGLNFLGNHMISWLQANVKDPITEIPYQNTSRLKTRVFATYYYYKMRDKYVKLLRINKAVAILQRGDFVYYSNIATEYKCDRGAFSRRIRGLIKSRKQADSFWRQCLINKQEEVLIQRINDLTDRAMPPTSQIIKNLVEEIKDSASRRTRLASLLNVIVLG